MHLAIVSRQYMSIGHNYIYGGVLKLGSPKKHLYHLPIINPFITHYLPIRIFAVYITASLYQSAHSHNCVACAHELGDQFLTMIGCESSCLRTNESTIQPSSSSSNEKMFAYSHLSTLHGWLHEPVGQVMLSEPLVGDRLNRCSPSHTKTGALPRPSFVRRSEG